MNNELHVFGGTEAGDLWHTIRHSTSWDPFRDVEARAGEQGEYGSLAAASVAGRFHLAVGTAGGRVWHTNRGPAGWQAFADVEAGEVPTLSAMTAAHTVAQRAWRAFLPVVLKWGSGISTRACRSQRLAASYSPLFRRAVGWDASPLLLPIRFNREHTNANLAFGHAYDSALFKGLLVRVDKSV